MIIKILGTGCPTCKLLQKSVEDAVEKLGLDCEIIKVTDMQEIMQYDIMSFPGLVLDEYLIFSGGVPRVDEMMDILAHRQVPQDPSVCCAGAGDTHSCPGGCCADAGTDCCGGGDSKSCCGDKDNCSGKGGDCCSSC